MSLQLDHLRRVTNIHWGEPEHFFMGGAVSTARVEKSFNGEQWEHNPPPTGTVINDAAYAGGIWIAVVNDITLRRSLDKGRTWQTISAPSFGETTGVRVAGGKPQNSDKVMFLLTTITGNENNFWWTEHTDDDLPGNTWTTGTISNSILPIKWIKFLNGIFFIGTDGNTQTIGDVLWKAKIFSSKTGKSWSSTFAFNSLTSDITFPSESAANQSTTDITFLKEASITLPVVGTISIGKYVLIGGNQKEGIPGDSASRRSTLAISTSTNGTSWSGGMQVGLDVASASSRVAASSEKFMILAKIYDGDVLQTSSTIDTLRSSNGSAWSRSHPGGSGWNAGEAGAAAPVGVAYSKSAGRFVAVLHRDPFAGATTHHVYSSDKNGTSWNEGNNAFTTGSAVPICLRIGTLFREE